MKNTISFIWRSRALDCASFEYFLQSNIKASATIFAIKKAILSLIYLLKTNKSGFIINNKVIYVAR